MCHFIQYMGPSFLLIISTLVYQGAEMCYSSLKSQRHCYAKASEASEMKTTKQMKYYTLDF